MVKAGRAKGDPPVEQETQQHPKENMQKKPPSGWRYYSPTAPRRWAPVRKQILASLAAIVAVTALLTLSIIVYFFGWQIWQIFVQAPWWVVGVVVALVAAVLALSALTYRKIWE